MSILYAFMRRHARKEMGGNVNKLCILPERRPTAGAAGRLLLFLREAWQTIGRRRGCVLSSRSEFTFPSSDGRTRIHAVEWLPEEHGPVGVLQLAHGIAEYALRYEPFARYMNRRGFIVAANDHLGHGQSVAEGAPGLYFGERDGWKHAVDDMYALRRLMGERYPGLPYAVLGHSMGSFLTRTYLIRFPGTAGAAVLVGTGQGGAARLALGRLAVLAVSRRTGPDSPSAIAERLVFGSYNRAFAPNRTDCDWLSASEENVGRYLADPLCGGKVSAGLFLDLIEGMRFIRRPSNLRHMNLSTPVLFLSGSRDPVGGMGKGVRAAYESFRAAGVRDVELRLYDGLRHEILNEDSREIVYADIARWLSNRLGRGGA